MFTTSKYIVNFKVLTEASSARILGQVQQKIWTPHSKIKCKATVQSEVP